MENRCVLSALLSEGAGHHHLVLPFLHYMPLQFKQQHFRFQGPKWDLQGLGEGLHRRLGEGLHRGLGVFRKWGRDCIGGLGDF